MLGAVDFLLSGPLPYPELGYPRIIGGWGISLGGASMLLAAARETTIRAVVADCAFAALVPLLEKDAKVPNLFIPGVAEAMRLLYGIDYHAIRPVDVVAKIAPRPFSSFKVVLIPLFRLGICRGLSTRHPRYQMRMSRVGLCQMHSIFRRIM